ncbi:MAG TPA: DALR anticodon-binding domain-containing protein [Streptosporangiaceae bacterium]
MITGDLDAAIAAVISHDGEFGASTTSGAAGPGQARAAGITSAGTWRPAPPGLDSAAGTYATTIAFALARRSAAEPAAIAAALARALARMDWVATARETGDGYLTVTVTARTLAELATRITQAGPACARSTALAGVTATVPRHVDLASAPTWEEARRRLTAVITGRLAETAGATIHFLEDAKRMAPANPAAPAGPSPAADAIAYAGADAITYTLARLPRGTPTWVDTCRAAEHHLGNPAYAVRYAHAHAASTLRQAADLGLRLGEAAEFEPRLPAHPREMSLLYELSWLAERVSGAARRAQPDVCTRYLEGLAGAYFSCQEDCPALAPGSVPDEEQPARLWLVAAARTVLRTGLDLLGVSAPDRL